MLKPAESAVNRSRGEAARARWGELLAAATCRGFFGRAAIEVAVQDGTIQHIQTRVERLEKETPGREGQST